MLWHAIGAVRDLGRLHDIASVLIRYGFGDLVRRIGMAGALERAGRALRWHEPEALARLEPPARVRRDPPAPGVLVRRGWRSLGSALALVAGLPQDLRQLLRSARRGKLHVEVDVLPLKQFGERLDRAASRLAISIVTAALIIGSAIVMTVEREPALPGLPAFGLLGFIAAVIGGLWVLLSIWRGGGRN